VESEDEAPIPPYKGVHPGVFRGEQGFMAYALKMGDEVQVDRFLDKAVLGDDYDRIFAVLNMLDATKARLSNGQKFKKLIDYREKAILEIKAKQSRVGCVWIEGESFKLMLLHGCIKKGSHWKTGEIQKLRRAYDNWVDSRS